MKYYLIKEAGSLEELEKRVEFFLGNSTYRPLGGPFVFGQFIHKFGQALVSTLLYKDSQTERESLMSPG